MSIRSTYSGGRHDFRRGVWAGGGYRDTGPGSCGVKVGVCRGGGRAHLSALAEPPNEDGDAAR